MTGKTPVRIPLRPPKIPQELAQNRNPTFAWVGRRISTGASDRVASIEIMTVRVPRKQINYLCYT
jgi:hypothetical protein